MANMGAAGTIVTAGGGGGNNVVAGPGGVSVSRGTIMAGEHKILLSSGGSMGEGPLHVTP